MAITRGVDAYRWRSSAGVLLGSDVFLGELEVADSIKIASHHEQPEYISFSSNAALAPILGLNEAAGHAIGCFLCRHWYVSCHAGHGSLSSIAWWDRWHLVAGGGSLCYELPYRASG